MHIFHFFVPHKKNNHRAALLHNLTLLILILSVTLISSLSVVIHKTHPEVLGISYQISDKELLNLTNFERAKAGLAPLSLNSKLTEAAKKKGAHMMKYDYWAHFAPDGTSPWDFIKGEGYDYTYAGENLAKGYTTSFGAMKGWMESPTHRANILSKQYSEVGFAIVQGHLTGEDTVLVVQELGSTDNLAGADKATLDGSNIAMGSVPQVNGSYQVSLPQGDPQSDQGISSSPAIDIGLVAKVITFILLSALLIALILDFIIIEKKKIPRTVGNNLDHVILVTVFLVFVVMAKLGHVI